MQLVKIICYFLGHEDALDARTGVIRCTLCHEPAAQHSVTPPAESHDDESTHRAA